jgi:hypothetical protein
MVWLTGQDRRIFRLTPEGKAECVYTIVENQFRVEGPSNGEPSLLAPIYSTSDGRGRVWVWSNTLAESMDWPCIRGVLVFDGNKVGPHPHLDGIPDKGLSAVEPDDAGHVWVAVAGDTLYRVDIDTFAATPVAEPEPSAFRAVRKIVRIGEDTFLVSGSILRPVPEEGAGGRYCTLWRLSNGTWTKLISGLDMAPESYEQAARPFVMSAGNLWLGAFATGPWYLAAGKQIPVLLDWRYGNPFDGSEGLFQLGDGRLLISSHNQGTTTLSRAELPNIAPAQTRFHTLNPPDQFIQDARNHLLGVLGTEGNSFSEWDGRSWTKHPFPGTFQGQQMRIVTADSFGRIWFLNRSAENSVAIFDPQRESFETFPTKAAALQAQLPRRNEFHMKFNCCLMPNFSSDGRICYLEESLWIQYFDGQEWHKWLPRDITGSQRAARVYLPQFDRAGNLAINIDEKTFEYTSEGGWRPTPAALPPDGRQERRLPTAVTPLACGFTDPESMCRDRLGIYWLTHRQQLYRAIPGACAPVFSPKEPQPFIDSRTLGGIYIDPLGNAFLETYFRSMPALGEYVLLAARQVSTRLNLQAKTDSEGSIHIHFAAPRGSRNVKYTWRIDDGDWNVPSAKAKNTLPWFPRGKHRIEAMVVGQDLEINPTPATAWVDVQVDPLKQIALLITKLRDSDYTVRNAAVTALVERGAQALPSLQSVRQGAAADERWWIDSAIQQIEATLAKSRRP